MMLPQMLVICFFVVFAVVSRGTNAAESMASIESVQESVDGDSSSLRVQSSASLTTVECEPSPCPTIIPVGVTFRRRPTQFPTLRPTRHPTESPTHHPSEKPTRRPSEQPSKHPSEFPTHNPSKLPTEFPTHSPSLNPTHNPTQVPVTIIRFLRPPSHKPSRRPTRRPTLNVDVGIGDTPTAFPSEFPTNSNDEPNLPTACPTFIFPIKPGPKLKPKPGPKLDPGKPKPKSKPKPKPGPGPVSSFLPVPPYGDCYYGYDGYYYYAPEVVSSSPKSKPKAMAHARSLKETHGLRKVEHSGDLVYKSPQESVERASQEVEDNANVMADISRVWHERQVNKEVAETPSNQVESTSFHHPQGPDIAKAGTQNSVHSRHWKRIGPNTNGNHPRKRVHFKRLVGLVGI